jgi:hypothetical protein
MSIQLDLLQPTHYQRFMDWVSTPAGRIVSDRFCSIASACAARGQKIGAKAIAERLRWHFQISRNLGDAFAINNNYTAYLARLATDRDPRLKGFFSTRSIRSGSLSKPRRAIMVSINEKPSIPFKQ